MPARRGTSDMIMHTETDIRAWLTARIATALDVPAEHVRPDDRFANMGIESMEAVAIGLDLEEWIGVAGLPPNLLWEYGSIDELSHYLSGAAAPGSGDDDIPAEHYRFDLLPAYADIRRRLAAIESSGFENPYFRLHHDTLRDTASVDDTRVVSFSGFNYLGMSGEPALVDAATEAMQRYGTSVSASRIVGGERPPHRDFERELAEFLGVEAALAFVGGHATNVSVIATLVGPRDLVVFDQRSHDSLLQGARLSGARMIPFAHNDWSSVDRMLAERRRRFERALIVVEGIYSADGDVCPLPRLVEIKERHKAWLFVDEAHSFGTLGETGRGITEHWGVGATSVDVWMTTLSKSLGSSGGAIAGSRAMIDLMRFTSSGFVNSVGLTPASAAAARAALAMLRDDDSRVRHLESISRRFDRRARRHGLDLGCSLPQGPVKLVHIGDDLRCIEAAARLFALGFEVQPMIAPSVPEGSARLRLFLTSQHSEAQIDDVVDATASVVLPPAPARTA